MRARQSSAPSPGSAIEPAISLDAFQDAFVAAVTAAEYSEADPALPPFAQQAGFAVYRNTVASACIDALAANHPTVLQIVGARWFEEAARVFIRSHRPSTGSLATYGDRFEAFLDAFEPARELPYLPGIARLDRFWNESHLAADAAPLDAIDLASLTPAEFAAMTLVPHPAARWATFAGLPVLTLWRRHREGGDVGGDIAWRGESALLTRPRGVVEWLAIDTAGAGFLDACARGASFADAASGAGDEAIAMLPALLAAGAFARAGR